LGCQLIVRRNRRDGSDAVLDAFIDEAIEANGLYCGGGGKGSLLDVVVELGRPLAEKSRALFSRARQFELPDGDR
jgi:uncharacterized protein YggL (DUF469 family)